jgi:hypothetical protein
MNTCKTCRWFFAQSCRRFAPRLDPEFSRELYGRPNEPIWPRVDEDDGCGEWEA